MVKVEQKKKIVLANSFVTVVYATSQVKLCKNKGKVKKNGIVSFLFKKNYSVFLE